MKKLQIFIVMRLDVGKNKQPQWLFNQFLTNYYLTTKIIISEPFKRKASSFAASYFLHVALYFIAVKFEIFTLRFVLVISNVLGFINDLMFNV